MMRFRVKSDKKVSFQQHLSTYNIPSSRPNGGQHSLYCLNETKIQREEDLRKNLHKSQPRGLYLQTLYGQRWGHRYIKPEHTSDTAERVIKKAVNEYISHMQISDENEAGEFDATIYTDVETSCFVFAKLNGIHCMLFLQYVRTDDEGFAEFKISRVAGKQNNFDGIQCNNASFGNVCLTLYNNAKFKILRSNLPKNVCDIIVQAELVVKSTDGEQHNHDEVSTLVFAFQNAESKQRKFEIANKLELFIFNVGGYEPSTGVEEEIFIPYPMCRMKKIFEDLHGQRYYPDCNPTDQCFLQVCPYLYFNQDTDLDLEDVQREISQFCRMFHDGEGYILRTPIKCIKMKRVYNKKGCLAVELTEHIVPALLRPGTEFNDKTPIEGLIIAPKQRDSDEHCDYAFIAFGRQPRGSYDGPTMWVAADYATSLCRLATPIPHLKLQSDTQHGRAIYSVTIGGRTLAYNFRDVEDRGFQLQFLNLAPSITHSEVPSVALIRANQIIPKRGRPVADTPVFQGLIVSGCCDFSRLTRREQCEVLLPAPTNDEYEELSLPVKLYLRNYTFGTVSPKIENWAEHNMPEDPRQQVTFIRCKTCFYEDLLRRPAQVHVMEYYKLLELIIKPRKRDNSNQQDACASSGQDSRHDRPEAVLRESYAQPVRASPQTPLAPMRDSRRSEFSAVKAARKEFGIDGRVQLCDVFEQTGHTSDHQHCIAILKSPNPTRSELCKLTRIYNQVKTSWDRRQVDEILGRVTEKSVRAERAECTGSDWNVTAPRRPLDPSRDNVEIIRVQSRQAYITISDEDEDTPVRPPPPLAQAQTDVMETDRLDSTREVEAEAPQVQEERGELLRQVDSMLAKRRKRSELMSAELPGSDASKRTTSAKEKFKHILEEVAAAAAAAASINPASDALPSAGHTGPLSEEAKQVCEPGDGVHVSEDFSQDYEIGDGIKTHSQEDLSQDYEIGDGIDKRALDDHDENFELGAGKPTVPTGIAIRNVDRFIEEWQ